MNELHKLDRDEETDDLNSEDLRRREQGDDNTKFFHSIANGRRRVSEIGPIVDEELTITGEEDKKNYFYRKFKERFTPEVLAPKSVGDWKDLFQENSVSAAKLSTLTRPFQLAEIKNAVFHLGKDKAPGPDGFPLSFYQAFWNTVKEDIMNIFLEMWKGNLSTHPIDFAYICLRQADNHEQTDSPVSQPTQHVTQDCPALL
uniref:Reverse transcriptase domain-containing protein n=1 Tax=Ananas comosus var. bracteatus TaxID=296719 RepID=A0A6V7NGC2_ANACO|nr:unnamed protein product [Ananas comosus var. bracteatus]